MALLPPSAHATPKHQQVFDDLRREILAGKYRPGQKLPSEADLVKHYGASRITVGRAVRELSERQFVERRAGSGTYVRADRSRGLSFGLLIPDLGRTAIFEEICQGMNDAPAAADHVLLWGNGGSRPGSADGASPAAGSTEARQEAVQRLCRQYIDRQVAGVFFAPLERLDSADRTNERVVAALEKARIPVVLLDRDFLPYPRRSRHDLVGIDNRRAGFIVTDHLLALGARRPVFLTYPHAAPTSAERLAGYREALFVHGNPADPTLIQSLDLENPASFREMLAAVRPDAVVCVNDLTAGVLMQNALALGLRLPQDLRVTGIDDADYARLLPVPLTTLRQPCREIGLAAMAAMQERLNRPDMPVRDILLECKLIVRSSCGA